MVPFAVYHRLRCGKTLPAVKIGWKNMDPKIIDDLAKRMSKAVPEGLRHLQNDLEQNFRGVLKGGLGRLDLVTREEFEVQQGVLLRTREKLEALEKKVAGAVSKL
jgi:BMFP domain-containing protein YqiC